jgi:hypothetical protein
MRQMAVDNDAEVWVGVLALQGAFREHLACLRKLPGVHAVEVRTKEQLASVDGLVIPGGALAARSSRPGGRRYACARH